MSKPGLSLSQAAVFVAIFLLYTNLPVVAAQRGLVPHAAAMVVPLLLAVAAVNQIIVWRRGVVIDRTLLLMTGLLALFLLGTLWAEGYAPAMRRIGAFITEGLVIYFLIRNAVRTVPDMQRAARAVVLAATLLASLAVIQAASGQYDQDFMGLAQRNLERFDGQATSAMSRDEMGLEDRARGPVNDPNRFAQILLMAAPLGLALTLNAGRRGGVVLGGLKLLLILAAVFFTYSRGGLLTLILLTLLLAPLRFVRPGKLAAALVVVALAAPIAIPGLGARISSIGGVGGLFGQEQVEADGPTRGRTTAMLSALAAFVDHPVLGVGPGQYVPYHALRYQSLPEISFREIAVPRRAHNLYLEIAAEMGTVGLLLFLTIPFLLLKDLETVRRALAPGRPDLARWAAVFMMTLFAYLGSGMFLHLAFERYYWLMIGLTASAAAVLHAAALSEKAALSEEVALDRVFGDERHLRHSRSGALWG